MTSSRMFRGRPFLPEVDHHLLGHRHIQKQVVLPRLLHKDKETHCVIKERN